MNVIDFSILNLKEMRRCLEKLWNFFFDNFFNWKFDFEVMFFGEMICYVWSLIFYYYMIIKNNGLINDICILYDDELIICVKKEIELV